MSSAIAIPRPLESALFGVNIASVNVSQVADVSSVIDQAGGNGTDMVVVRVAAHNVDVIHSLEDSGARMCDVLVTYSTVAPLWETRKRADEGEMHIREVRSEDGPLLHALAVRAFNEFPGHWHTDARLNRTHANELYGRWVTDLSKKAGPASPLLVVESVGGELCGFLALAQDAAGGWSVPLTAVDSQCRGKGLLQRMLVEASGRICPSEAIPFSYETQLTNWSASRVVSSLGFIPSAARFTFHLWVRRP